MSVHFHALKVAEIVPETADANSIRFTVTIQSVSAGAVHSE